MALAYIGLGSNLGDKHANLRAALDELAKHTILVSVSNVYQTKPWGVGGWQPDFLNMAAKLETTLTAKQLLSLLKQIECQVGRKPNTSDLPRELDLDLLLFDDLVMCDEDCGLVLPHPYMTQRAFVLIPMTDIAPTLTHPLTGRTIASMCAALGQQGVEQVGGL